MKRLFFSGPALLVGLCLLWAGCKGKDRTPEFLRSADQLFKTRQYEKAEGMYQNVLRLHSGHPAAVRNLGLLYVELGQFDRAVIYLTRTRDLMPNDLEVRTALARGLYATGALKAAREETLQILRQSPGTDDSIILLADLAVRTNEITEARRALTTGRDQVGDKAAFHAAFGNLYCKERNAAKAEEEYALARKSEPHPGIVDSAIAGYLWSKGDLTNAEIYFKKAMAAEPIEPLREFQWVDFKLKTRPLAESKPLLLALAEKQPRMPMAWLYLAEAAAQEGQVGDCKYALGKLFAADPLNLGGRLLLARLRVNSGAFQAAAQELERLSQVYPRSAPLLHQLGGAYFMNKDLVKALASFDRALVADPEHQPTILALADLNLRRGEYATAISALRMVIQKNPKLYDAYTMLAEAYRLRGTPDDALLVYQRLGQILPNDARVPYVTGLTLRSAGRNAEARRAFERTLEMSPGDTASLAQLVDLEVRFGRTNEAVAHLEAAVAKNPQSVTHRLLLAELHLHLRHLETAETNLTQVLQLQPDNPGAFALLAKVFVASEKHQQALERLEAALKKSPGNPTLLLQVGLIYDLLKQYDKARDAYEAVLRATPDDGFAMNNLACLYSDQFNQLDKAYELAQKAHDLNPRNVLVADTLGWILFKRREYPWALTLLREAASGLDTDPEVQYHLGLAHYMMGDEAPARAALERALQSPRDFRGRADLQRWLAFLKAGGEGDAEQNVAVLERRLGEEPNDSVALRRLAAIYEGRGQMEKALGLYEHALKLNPKAVVPLLRLADYYGLRLHQRDKALEYAKRAHNAAPGDPVVGQALGRLVYEAGDHKWALSLLQESARRQPRQPELLYDLGCCYYALGRTNEAGIALRDALGLPDFTRTNQARLFLEMAALAGNSDQALAQQARVLAVLKEDPRHLPAWFARGLIEERRGQVDEALKTYESILAGGFDLFLPAIRRLALLYAARGDDKRGFEVAKQARESLPADPEVAQALGRIVFQRGDFAWAARLFAEVVRSPQPDPTSFYYLGFAQARSKAPREAKTTLTRALQLDPKHPMAAEARELLKDLK